jgi:hypothetical protein
MLLLQALELVPQRQQVVVAEEEDLRPPPQELRGLVLVESVP